MIPELGLLSLIIAFVMSLLSGILPIWLNRRSGTTFSLDAWVYGQGLFVCLSYGILSYLFLSSDFSVLYVAMNSAKILPWYYRITAVWGAHEGSMLLWVFILSMWILVFTNRATLWRAEVKNEILQLLSLLQSGFIAFILFTSNPFQRYFEAKLIEGQDLNPLLQDPGFLIHPPVLYIGYVGFAIAFAVSVVGLKHEVFDEKWARALRPWTQIAWLFLTLGIALGSWWAYRELGWGGWWFWDPVENASFMPWLTGTALLHSLVVSDKRKQFYAWTILLAIITFSLSLLGTFLVRSGVLTSVHAFASDPKRGVYILIFLALIVGSSLLLFADRADKLKTDVRFKRLSKESLLLVNNLIMTVLMTTVLIGTLYPLVMQVLDLGKLSVGAPYFNAFFVPILLPTMLLMGASGTVMWHQSRVSDLMPKLIKHVWIVLAMLVSVLIWSLREQMAFYLGLLTAFWLIVMTLSECLRSKSGYRLRVIPQTLAHLGVAVTAIGITVTTQMSSTQDLAMAIGDTINVGSYQLRLISLQDLKAKNYDSLQGHFELKQNGNYISTLRPEKRFYRLRRQVMTDAAIYATPFRDIYLALGNPIEDGKRIGVRVYDKPFIRWIWSGSLLMAFGILVSFMSSSRRKTDDS